jgi:hypothetical protein
MMLDSIDPDFEALTLPATTEQELLRFMHDWHKLSEKRDAARLDRMLPEDLVITTSDGRVLTKREFLDNLKNMPDDFRLRDHEKTVQIFDHTAIVRAGYVLEMNGTSKNLRYTATFIKRGGRWEVVSLQSSLLVND